MAALHMESGALKTYAKVYTYPGGYIDIIASDKPDFGAKGWEAAEDWSRPATALPVLPEPEAEAAPASTEPEESGDNHAADQLRSMRRARARVRRLALSNEFSYFVTLTLDQSKVDRYDMEPIVKKLNSWCNNQVKRHGLQYILVPERHKDGAIHFHGFFNGALSVEDSGTMKVPGCKKPKRPRSKAQRAQWEALGAQTVYNLPAWTLGYTTAIKLHGDYRAAVGYVCKYIGKQGDKPAGRWYYSGGGLSEPGELFAELTTREALEQFGEMAYKIQVPGRSLAIINGYDTGGNNYDFPGLEYGTYKNA